MKKLLFLIILLILPLAQATDNVEYLKIGETMEWNTRTVTLLAVYEDSVIVLVDDEWKAPVPSSGALVEGVEIEILQTFPEANISNRGATLNLTVHWRNLCDEDSDCDDNNACTIDKCIGTPKSCDYGGSHTNITACISGDGCCPFLCTYSKDTDCPKYTCKYHDNECNDKDPSTNDSCNLDKGECEFTPITWCASDDNYCPDGCIWTLSLDPKKDMDCSKDNECNAHSECDDNDDSTVDTCEGNPKKCIFTKTKSIIKSEDDKASITTSNKDVEDKKKTPKEAITRIAKEATKSRPLKLVLGLSIAGLAVYIILARKLYQSIPEK